MKNMKERMTNLDIAHGSARSATDIASGSGSRGNEAGRPLSVRQSSTPVVAREGSAGRLAPWVYLLRVMRSAMSRVVWTFHQTRDRATELAVGDRVIFARADGLYNIQKVIELTPLNEEGILEGTFDKKWSNSDSPLALETAKRPPVKSIKEAYEIARGELKSGGHVWVSYHTRSNQVERFYP
jgi:hypothetical protein